MCLRWLLPDLWHKASTPHTHTHTHTPTHTHTHTHTHTPHTHHTHTHHTHTHTHTHTLKSSVKTVRISVEIWTGIFLKQSSRLNQRTVTSGCSEWCAVTSCPSQARRLYNTNCNESFLQCLFVGRFGTSCTHSGVSCTAVCCMSTAAILIYTKPKRWVEITRKCVANI